MKPPRPGDTEDRILSNDISLEVSLSRDSYIVDEPVYLHVRLQNESDDVLPVVPLKVSSSDIAGNLGIVMTREDGVREYHPPYAEGVLTPISHAADLLPLLEPGKSWIIVVELLSYFSKEKGLIARPEERIRIGRGTYQLQAFYRWDYRPSLVVRSNTRIVTVEPPPFRERWKRWWLEKGASWGANRGDAGNDPVRACQEIYAADIGRLFTSDRIRSGIKRGMEEDLLGAIGAYYVVEENQDSPPYLLYDLITYREVMTEEEDEVYHRFLDELIARWPDGFLGEVARQKKMFEEIALGGIPSAVRSKKKDA